MSDIRKARHRRRKTALYVGVPLALTAAGTMAYGAAFGIFGEDAKPRASAAGAAPAWATATADGFASVDALGQHGTYGGRDGRTVTPRTLLNALVVRFRIPGGDTDPVRGPSRVGGVPHDLAKGDRPRRGRSRGPRSRGRARRGARPGSALSFDVAMDPRTRTVTRADRPLDLTRTEYALLEYLLRHPARVLSRAQILKGVWGFDFEPTSNTLDVYVMYLRRKLESHGGPRLIHTVRGLGYTLRAAR